MLIEEVLPAIRQGKKAKRINKRGCEDIVYKYNRRMVFTDGAVDRHGELIEFYFNLMSNDINDNSWEIIE